MAFCDICGASFINQSNLKRHQTLIHSEAGKDKMIKCDICDYIGVHHNLMQHMRNVHGKVIKCSLCEENFMNKKNLSRHMTTMHKDLEPFQCNIVTVHMKPIHKFNYYT